MSPVEKSASAALARVPLFSELSADELDQIVTASSRRAYAKGSILFHEGDPGDFLLLLLSGRAKVVLQSERGQEVILSVVEPPDVIGHLAILDGAPRSATVIALDALETRRLAREPFLELMRQDRQILEGLLTHLAASLRETNEQVRTALMFDIHGQVIRALVRRGLDDGDQVVVDPRPTHLELAQMIGKARETVSRALQLLKDGGYLVEEGKAFVLKKTRAKHYLKG